MHTLQNCLTRKAMSAVMTIAGPMQNKRTMIDSEESSARDLAVQNHAERSYKLRKKLWANIQQI